MAPAAAIASMWMAAGGWGRASAVRADSAAFARGWLVTGLRVRHAGGVGEPGWQQQRRRQQRGGGAQ